MPSFHIRWHKRAVKWSQHVAARAANLYPFFISYLHVVAIWKSDKLLECHIENRLLHGTNTGNIESIYGLTCKSEMSYKQQPPTRGCTWVNIHLILFLSPKHTHTHTHTHTVIYTWVQGHRKRIRHVTWVWCHFSAILIFYEQEQVFKPSGRKYLETWYPDVWL